MDLHSLTIHQLHDLLVRKEVTSREITQALYRRIGEVDGKIKAYLLLTEEEAFRQADEVDQPLSSCADNPIGMQVRILGIQRPQLPLVHSYPSRLG